MGDTTWEERQRRLRNGSSDFYRVYNFNFQAQNANGSIIGPSEKDVQVSISKKKDSNDGIIMFKHNESGQTNDDSRLYFVTNNIGSTHNLHVSNSRQRNDFFLSEEGPPLRR